MDRAADIAVLRARLARAGLADAEGQSRAALGHGPADACLKGGILKGALHEVFPTAPGDEAAASGFAMGLAVRAAEGKRLLWCAMDFAALEHGGVWAPGLVELGLDPDRFLLLRAPDAASVLRGGLDALSCTALGAVVLEIPGTPKLLDLSASRRMVLAAAASGVTAVLLRLDAEAEASAAETRWVVRAAPSASRSRARHLPHASAFALRASADKSHGGGKTNKEDWGAPRFDAELVRHRHGRTGHWVMEWNCDEGYFAADAGLVAAAPADRPAQAEREHRVA